MLIGEAPGNGKAQTLKIDEVKSREPSRILCNNSTSVNDAPPINPTLQLAMQHLEKYDNVNDCDLSLRGRPVSEMESEEDCNLERSALEQKDEINPFSNQYKTSPPHHLKQEMMLLEVFALSFKRMVHVCEETVSTSILIVQQHIPMLGLLEGKVVKQVPGLDQCQEQVKDQELNFAGTELKIKFTVVTVTKVTVGLVRNAEYLCPYIQKITPVMIQM